jgi:D-ribulokinase
MPATFAGAGHFFDLADYLSWRATGSDMRSTCTLTCKWTYLAHERRWSDSFLATIGLGELADDDHRRIGHAAVPPGTAVGAGLTAAAARDLGLDAGTPVAAGLIDAHAGGLGTLGGQTAGGDAADPTRRLGYIMGTSACIMATTERPTFVPGVWGPYFDAMVPGLWLNEGGQSAAGAALDHLVRAHPAHAVALAEAQGANMSVLDYLETRVAARFGDISAAARLAASRHVLPEFLGNRSPYADPEARAVIAGGSLDDTVADLEVEFIAGLCGLAYGLADVVEALKAKSVVADEIVASGGASHSRLVRQLLADATGLKVTLPQTREPVLLGAAMLGAVAGGAYASLPAAMAAMSRDGAVTNPGPQPIAEFHAAKREAYALLRGLERELRQRMAGLRAP